MPAGYEPDGLDVSSAWRGQPFVRTQPLFWHNPTANRRGPQFAMREGAWKLLMEPDGTLAELYDLDRDAGESTNIARSRPDVVERLSSRLRKWHRTLPPPLERTWVEPQHSTRGQ